MYRSASNRKLCGAIFDVPAKRKQLELIEAQISDPTFWNNQEGSQKVMQERKRLEDGVGQDNAVSSLTSDIDTLFELGREGEDVGAELAREISRLRKMVDQLETNMLLSGENDHCGAIVTIHP